MQTIKRFIDLLKATKRPGINELLVKLSELGFFEKPASSKFHSNFPGGLCEHSLAVFYLFNRLHSTSKIKLNSESIKIVCLLHDVCKCMVKPEHHGLSSVNFIKEYIELTELEEKMILYHMGHYGKEYTIEEYNQEANKYPLIKMLYFADDYCSQFIEKRI